MLQTCVANSTCLQEFNASSKLCLKKECLLLNPNCMNSNRECVLSIGCIYSYVGVPGQHSLGVSGT